MPDFPNFAFQNGTIWHESKIDNMKLDILLHLYPYTLIILKIAIRGVTQSFPNSHNTMVALI